MLIVVMMVMWSELLMTSNFSLFHIVVVVDPPLLCVAVEGSDNPISLEKPCQAYLPPDQQRHHSLGRHLRVQLSRRSASHAAGMYGWLPQKTGWLGLWRGGVGGYNLHSPPNCGTPTTSRLYLFGASLPYHYQHR